MAKLHDAKRVTTAAAPAVPATAGAVRPYIFVSDEQWSAIFRAVERGETLASAIRVALGPERDPSVVYTAIRSDELGLGRRLSNAKAVFAGEVMREIRRRAIEGTDEPNYFEGRVVGFTKKYSDKLLESLARNLPGSDWLDARKASDVTTHNGDAGGADILFSLSYDVVAQMPPAIRRSLIPALTWIKQFANVPQPRELATADIIDVSPAADGADFTLTAKQRAGDWS